MHCVDFCPEEKAQWALRPPTRPLHHGQVYLPKFRLPIPPGAPSVKTKVLPRNEGEIRPHQQVTGMCGEAALSGGPPTGTPARGPSAAPLTLDLESRGMQ